MSDALMFAMDRESAGVVVWFECTAHAFTKTGFPTQMSSRERAVVRALLSAAIDDLDAAK